MNQLHPDLQIESAALVTATAACATSSNPRLVVVIREVQEEAMLAGRIQEVARARGLSVLLVGIARDAATEAALRRNLVTVAAFLKEGNAHAGLPLRRATSAPAPEIQIEHGRDWLSKVRANLKPGDTLACYSEEPSGLFDRPLSDTLSCAVDMPVYTFTTLRAERSRGRDIAVQAASWIGSIASIGGFLMLQARIVLAVQGWVQSALLLITLLAEVGVVWAVNSVSGRV